MRIDEQFFCPTMGMYDKDPFTFILNVITPVVLTLLDIVSPQSPNGSRVYRTPLNKERS